MHFSYLLVIVTNAWHRGSPTFLGVWRLNVLF